MALRLHRENGGAHGLVRESRHLEQRSDKPVEVASQVQVDAKWLAAHHREILAREPEAERGFAFECLLDRQVSSS